MNRPTPHTPTVTDLIVLLLCATVISGCATLTHSTRLSTIGERTLGSSGSATRCSETFGLPDPRCTPGATRPGIALAAICALGYSRSVRPPESYTEVLKFKQMLAYHLSGSASRYEEDHLVPLSIGGAPRDPANLWPEPRTGPNSASEKDELETWAARMACSGRIPLARLQHEMATDWVALYRAAGAASALRSYPPGG